MQKSGFFNALLTNGEYDRKYNANDYCDNLAVVISNGVLRGVDDDLRVTASGMVVSVGVGRAWINGHYYVNDTDYSFATITAPTGGARYDRVVLRLDKSLAVRSVELVYVQGTAANSPTKPALVREGNIYDIAIADIYVGTNATSVSVIDTRGNNAVCGWVYSTSGDNSFFASLDNAFDAWFSGVKDTLATVTTEVEYKQLTVLSAQTNTVQITLPQYDETINQKIDVYVNGLRQHAPTDYSVSGAVVTFTGNLTAGTEVQIVVTVSKDGSGIPSVVDDVTELQNKVADLENGLMATTYTYVCNGINDNVEISTLAQDWLNANSDYASLKINVYGTFGTSGAVTGEGTSTSPYIWFMIGAGGKTNRRVVVDFSNCSEIEILPAANSYNTVFFGLQTHVISANVTVNGGTNVTMFSTAAATQSYAENCRFWLQSGNGYIARGGVFRDCFADVVTTEGNAYCFNTLSGGLLRVFGGEYYAYAPTGGMSTVIYVNAAQTGAVVNTYSMSCPTVANGGRVQTHAINCNTSDACCSFTDTITPLQIVAPGQNIRGTIAINKTMM